MKVEGWKWIGNGQWSVGEEWKRKTNYDSGIDPTACWLSVGGNSDSRHRKQFFSRDSTAFEWLTLAQSVDRLMCG